MGKGRLPEPDETLLWDIMHRLWKGRFSYSHKAFRNGLCTSIIVIGMSPLHRTSNLDDLAVRTEPVSDALSRVERKLLGKSLPGTQFLKRTACRHIAIMSMSFLPGPAVHALSMLWHHSRPVTWGRSTMPRPGKHGIRRLHLDLNCLTASSNAMPTESISIALLRWLVRTTVNHERFSGRIGSLVRPQYRP